MTTRLHCERCGAQTTEPHECDPVPRPRPVPTDADRAQVTAFLNERYGTKERAVSELSQAQIIGQPRAQTWDDYEQGCLSTFGGGHRGECYEAFQHGMQTVFRLLRAEFPPAEQCRENAALLRDVRAVLGAVLDDEEVAQGFGYGAIDPKTEVAIRSLLSRLPPAPEPADAN